MVDRRFVGRIDLFGSDQSGSATIWSLGMTVVFLLIGGLAIDVGNAYRTRELLQMTADSAAHAGVQDLSSPEAATALALEYAEYNMPAENFGTVLDDASVMIGTWDPETRAFTETAVNPDAVRVLTSQTSATGNPVATFLLKLANFESWDISTRATAQRFYRRCHENGIVADGRVRISADNTFSGDYCLHGQDGITIGTGNVFEPGARATMYDLDDVTLGVTGYEDNPGLEDALAEDFVLPVLARKAAEIAVDLQDPVSIYQPPYISALDPAHTVDHIDFSVSELLTGRVNVVTGCGGTDVLTLDGDVEDLVLSTDCKIAFGPDIRIANAVIATSRASSSAITALGPVELGRDDDCAPGGGSQLISAGRVVLAEGSAVHGSHIVAADDIRLRALEGGIDGSSFQSGDDVVMLEDGMFSGCAGTTDLIAHVSSYRLVD
jgi:Flp pilus assembly protein TadG